MKRILFVAILSLSLIVCLTYPAWAGGLDDAKAGDAAGEKGDYDKAIADYTTAIETGELSRKYLSIAYYRRGLAWKDKGEYVKAIEDFATAKQLGYK